MVQDHVRLRIPGGEQMRAFLEDNGYTDLRQIDGKWYGLMRMAYNTRLCCNLDKSGLDGGICFSTWRYAREFLINWDGKTDPIVGEDGCKADKRSLRPSDDEFIALLNKLIFGRAA